MTTHPSAQYSLTLRVEMDAPPRHARKGRQRDRRRRRHDRRDRHRAGRGRAHDPGHHGRNRRRCRLAAARPGVDALLPRRVLDAQRRTFAARQRQDRLQPGAPLRTSCACDCAARPASRACWCDVRLGLRTRPSGTRSSGMPSPSSPGRVLARRLRPRAAIWSMEGKAMLFKAFANVTPSRSCARRHAIRRRSCSVVLPAFAPGFGGSTLAGAYSVDPA